MQINLYRGFEADQRLSMYIYADQLAACFRSLGWSVNDVRAQSHLEKLEGKRWRMRYLRYWQFPRSVRNQAAQVHHVADHGYAHLWPYFTAATTSVSVHDLIPLLAYKGLIGGQARMSRPWLNQYSLSFVKRFDQVVVPSQSTSQDLQAHLGIDAQKIVVIPPIIGQHFQPDPIFDKAQFSVKHKLASAQYWVLISGQEFYKNHATSLAVIKHLREEGLEVKIIKTGIPSVEFDQLVTQLGLQEHVAQIFLTNSTELVDVYNFVDCLLFPSTYEGFGMPVIESLACATPVVSSTAGSLPELGGDLVARAEHHDVDSLTQLVMRTLQADFTEPEFRLACEACVAAYRPTEVAKLWQRAFERLGH